jgi:hypothetical protein
MDGRDAVFGSSVNFAVCTRNVPPATDDVSPIGEKVITESAAVAIVD